MGPGFQLNDSYVLFIIIIGKDQFHKSIKNNSGQVYLLYCLLSVVHSLRLLHQGRILDWFKCIQNVFVAISHVLNVQRSGFECLKSIGFDWVEK